MTTERPLEDRFWDKVHKDGPILRPDLGPCWMWTGFRQSSGHGRIKVGPKMEGTHRVAFFLAEGRWPVPAALHHCDNPPCARRSHIFEGTQADNLRDMCAKGRNVRGESSGVSKLCDEDVRAIRDARGTFQRVLAARFGVSRSLVGLIRQGKIWKHLEKTT